ncbi:exocyst complex component EXO70E2 [Neltuma alba]|uniref:exocyst complex component EXO70E2 n=1 Tax=Neltuma alba TaxID=207710 RepID=UPI0010A3BDE7|nr:exocyst complex component EXO70E2-like [Prosopis alba]
MEEHESSISTYEGEQHVVAAAQHILKALAASKNVNDGLRKSLLDLENHLSSMPTRLADRNGKGIWELERRLKCAEDKVMSWEANNLMIWDSGPGESSEYLNAVGEIQSVTQSLQTLSVNEKGKQKELVQRADGVLQIAMSRLEEELVHILVQHKQFFEPEYMSFHSNRVDMVFDESFGSAEDEPVEEVSQSDGDFSQPEACTLDLVRPDVILDLKCIADVMFASKYHQEFCQAFITSRRHALDEYFVILGMEKLSIEHVLRMDWSCLNSEMKKWIRVMKIIVKVYLASEKRLCKQILGQFGSVYESCFCEISRNFMLPLLNFAEAIAVGTHTPERLFRLLDMYEVLEDLALVVNILFFEEAGCFLRNEFQKLVRSFGHTVRSTFLAFESTIATYPSTKKFPGGGIHHLTKYVMNYIKTITGYEGTLGPLLADVSAEAPPDTEHDSTTALATCPMACHFRSITTALESNLRNKSKLYKDVSLQHIFMMNNIHYMVQKVKSSELSQFFGDEWLRRNTGKFRHEAISYERAIWSSVLSMLKEDSKDSRQHCALSLKATLKRRCTDFNTAFEEVYITQTGWFIPDPQLREELQISISQKLIHAYRTFIGRISSSISEKWIKYTVGDLEGLILDLFQGSSKSLSNRHRRK